MQPQNGPPATGERWNVNMPAVVGVVVVFLIGVVVWVVVSSADEDAGGAAVVATTGAPAAPLRTTSTAVPPPTLSPTPLPTSTSSTTIPPTTAPATTTSAPTTAPATTTTSPPSTASPTTTAPDAGSSDVRGDLDIPDQPMGRPPCDGGYITVVASPVGEQATAEAVGAVLDSYPGSNYLRTDQSCPSLTQDVDGEPIYVIYFGPFVVASDACSARADGPADAYARTLSDELGPDHSVDCT